jgi:hypothetical protein
MMQPTPADSSRPMVAGEAQPAPAYANGTAQPYPAPAGATNTTVVVEQPPVFIPPEVNCCCCISIGSANSILIFFGLVQLGQISA